MAIDQVRYCTECGAQLEPIGYGDLAGPMYIHSVAECEVRQLKHRVEKLEQRLHALTDDGK